MADLRGSDPCGAHLAEWCSRILNGQGVEPYMSTDLIVTMGDLFSVFHHALKQRNEAFAKHMFESNDRYNQIALAGAEAQAKYKASLETIKQYRDAESVRANTLGSAAADILTLRSNLVDYQNELIEVKAKCRQALLDNAQQKDTIEQLRQELVNLGVIQAQCEAVNADLRNALEVERKQCGCLYADKQDLLSELSQVRDYGNRLAIELQQEIRRLREANQTFANIAVTGEPEGNVTYALKTPSINDWIGKEVRLLYQTSFAEGVKMLGVCPVTGWLIVTGFDVDAKEYAVNPSILSCVFQLE